MPSRDAAIVAFLASNGWDNASRSTLADDASFRRYERISDGGRTVVLMDAPPPKEDVRPFTKIAGHLIELGFSAPRILAEDAETGLLLLEDFGDDTFTRALASAPETEWEALEERLYASATDVLSDLHNRSGEDALPVNLPRYTMDRYLDEVLLLTDWYQPAITGQVISAENRAAYTTAWQGALKPVLATEPTLVLRDYHVDNLVWLPSRDGVQRCGLLDFQDALAGPAAYDLMSLLEDARRDIRLALRDRMWRRYISAMPNLREPGPARDQFETVFAILAAQRHAKVIGIFTRLCVRDAKPDYLVHIPRVWKLLEANLRHPALASVAEWMNTHLPADRRGIPNSAMAET